MLYTKANNRRTQYDLLFYDRYQPSASDAICLIRNCISTYHVSTGQGSTRLISA